MKYYSEYLDSLFDTEEELNAAEEKIRAAMEEKEKEKKKMKEERTARAKEVEEAQKYAIESIKNYRKLLNKFCEDYGSFHMTLDKENYPAKDMMEIFRSLF